MKIYHNYFITTCLSVICVHLTQLDTFYSESCIYEFYLHRWEKCNFLEFVLLRTFIIQFLLVNFVSDFIFLVYLQRSKQPRGGGRLDLNYISGCIVVYWKRILRDYGLFIQNKHQICSMLSECKCMGMFSILNLTQFSQNRLLTMKYCSVKDCKCTSSCENGILIPAHDKGVVDFNVTWKTNSPFKYFQKSPPSIL